MKNLTSKLCRMLLVISGTFLLPFSSYAQLNGSYTINPLGSASSTNYKDWASAVSDLTNGTRSDGGTAQGPGVSGAVNITVYDTVYANTRIELGAISGASASSIITFKSASGDSTKCLVQYASTTSAGTDDHVLWLNGSTYITFQEIGFERTGANTYSTVVEISGNADNITLLRCWMKGRRIPSSSSLGFQYGIGSVIYFTGSTTNILIQDSKLIYGYNGVYSVYSGTNNIFSGNSIDTSGSAGIYLSGQTNLKVIGNSFNMGDFGPNQGHYTSYGMRIEGAPGMLITKNKVHMYARNSQVCRAVVLANNSATSTAPTLVNNNFVINDGGTGSCTGFALYACYYMDFYYNNVLITGTLTDAAAYYHYATYANSNINLVNNSLVNKGGGLVYNVPGTNTADLDVVNYNNLYTNGSYIGNWAGTNYTTMSGWQSASGKDANSVYGDPGYTSNSDLHVSNINLNAKAYYYSRVTDDIDGDIRNTSTPDIGADEFFPVTLDAGPNNLDSPSVFCAGIRNVKASFQNYGIDTIKSIRVNWSINGNTQTYATWTGVVAPGGSSSPVLLGSFNFAANTKYTFKIWTSNPNSGSDQKTSNDTITVIRYAGMSGSYTIGDTSVSNYKSFSDAIGDMTTRGICGAITFNVYNGTYNEQLGMVQLPGMGASNPIIFQSISGDSTRVLITLPTTTATGTNNAALQLRGADYITFKGMTFQRTGTNPFGQVIHIYNGSHHNTFTNCQMLGQVQTSLNTNAINIWSDQSIDSNNTFRNNYIKEGAYNMYYMGTASAHETGTVIEGNIFENSYNSAVFLNYNDGATVKGNTFNNIRVTAAGNYDVQLNDCDSDTKVMGNFFYDGASNNGIMEIGNESSSSKPGLIANNFFLKSYGTAISLDGVANKNVVFNTIYFSGSATTNAGIMTTGTAASGIVMKNNLIYMEGGSVFNITTGSQVTASDYNDLLSKTTPFGIWNGTSANNFFSLKSTSGKDGNSFNIDPLFVSGTDLHIRNPVLKNAGVPITGVTIDIDNQARDVTNPDIGADEFELLPNDAGITSVLSPYNGACAGLIPITAVIRNFGKDTLKTATINWKINGASQTAYSWSGKLATKGLDTVTVGTFTFIGGTSPVVVVQTSMPNGQTDGITANDSQRVTRQIKANPVASAGPDQTVCLGDSVQLGPGPLSGFTYEWTNAAHAVIATTSQFWYKPTIAQSLYLKITNSTLCSGVDTIVVSLGIKPTINAGQDQTICKGVILQLGATSQSGFTYNWTSNPAGFTSTISNPTVTPAANTSYFLKMTNSVSGCTAYDTAVIIVNPVPVPQVAGDATICDQATEVYSTGNTTGNTYAWNVTGGSIQAGQGTNSLTVKWTGAGAGSVQVIENNSFNCKDTSSMSVTISANPVAKFGITGRCVGLPLSFNDSSSNVSSRNWDFGDGFTSNLPSTTHIYASAATYNVKLVVSNAAGCLDSLVQQLKVVNRPQADFTIGAITCEGSNISFTNASTNAVSYFWDFGNGNTGVQTHPVIVYPTAGTYNVKLTAFGSACNDSLTKQLIVNPLPDAGFTAGVNHTVVDFAPKDTNAASYLWNFGDGNTSILKKPQHTYSLLNQYVHVTLTVTSQEGCSNTFSDSLFIIENSISEFLPNSLISLNISPNPFKDKSHIELSLHGPGAVNISLYDITGRKITTLLNGNYFGTVGVDIDAEKLGLGAGVYFAWITIDERPVIRRIIRAE